MRDLQTVWEELRRRKVFRAAAIYAVVAWGVLQVADVVWEPLGLPPWTMTLVIVLVVLGFPLVLTLEWVFELTSAGVRRTSVRRTSESERAGAGRSLTLPPLVGGGAVLLVAAIGAWWLAGGRGPDPSPGEPVSESAVVLFPCEVRGGEELSHMSEGMVLLLASRLQGSTDLLRPVDPRSVLSYLDREATDGIDGDQARHHARRLGAGQYIRCDVLELFGGDVQVRATLYRIAGEDDPVVDVGVEGPVSELSALADDLTARILTGSFGSGSRLAQEAARTTEDVPLDAWTAYVEGERAYRRGRYAEAMARLGEAVELDPTFALAHYRLALAGNWSERRDVEARAVDDALAHADRLSRQDRDLLEAYAAYARGEHAEAKRRASALTRAYPEDLEAWYLLGEILFHFGWLSGEPIARADSVLSRAAELDPGNLYYEVLFHLIHLASADRDIARLDSLADRVGPDNPWVRVPLLFARGDRAAVDSVALMIESGDVDNFFLCELAPSIGAGERVAEAFLAPTQPDYYHALAHLELAGIRVARGDWEGALERIARAAQLRPALTLEMKAYHALAAAPEMEGVDFRLLAAELEAWDPPTNEALPEAVPVNRWHDAPHAGLHPWLRLYLLGLVEARAGETASALHRAGELAVADAPAVLEEWLRDLELVVRAEVARAENDPARALALLTNAPLWTVVRPDPRFSPILAHFYPVVMRAELAMELGQPHEALRWYRGLELPFWMPTDAIGTRVLIGKARALEAIGEQETARALRAQARERQEGATGAVQN